MKILNTLFKLFSKIKLNRLKLQTNEIDRIETLIGASKIFSVPYIATLTKALPEYNCIIHSKLVEYFDDLVYISCITVGINSVKLENHPNLNNLLKGVFIKIVMAGTKTKINPLDKILELENYIKELSIDYDIYTSVGSWILFRLGINKNANKQLQKLAKEHYQAKAIGGPIVKEFYNAWKTLN